MLLGRVFERFAALAPVCVSARAVLEAAFSAEALDRLFDQVAQRQYTRTLLFSTCVQLMTTVVCRVHRTIHAAYQASPAEIAVSLKALYDKLEHLEPNVSAELVRHTARRLTRSSGR